MAFGTLCLGVILGGVIGQRALWNTVQDDLPAASHAARVIVMGAVIKDALQDSVPQAEFALHLRTFDALLDQSPAGRRANAPDLNFQNSLAQRQQVRKLVDHEVGVARAIQAGVQQASEIRLARAHLALSVSYSSLVLLLALASVALILRQGRFSRSAVSPLEARTHEVSNHQDARIGTSKDAKQALTCQLAAQSALKDAVEVLTRLTRRSRGLGSEPKHIDIEISAMIRALLAVNSAMKVAKSSIERIAFLQQPHETTQVDGSGVALSEPKLVGLLGLGGAKDKARAA